MQFPKDSFPHKSVIEWWYFNGHLFDKNKNKYAFMNCLFKADPKKTDISIIKNIPLKEVYFSHSLLLDITNKKRIVNLSPISILSKDSLKQENLFINYINPLSGYINNELIEDGKFRYKLKNENLDLLISAIKKPLLHNGKGYFVVKNKKVFYYSLTKMAVNGKIHLGKKSIEVSGEAWMDHEWSTIAGEKKWKWFSIQLDNNCELMIQEYNNFENSYVGIMHQNQKAEFAHDLILSAKKTWKSPITKTEYPISWKIIVPSKKIELDVEAILPNQEIIFGSMNYWEGPIKVRGIIGSLNVKGNGFMEIVGENPKNSKLSMYNYNLTKKGKVLFKIAKREANKIFKDFISKYHAR